MPHAPVSPLEHLAADETSFRAGYTEPHSPSSRQHPSLLLFYSSNSFRRLFRQHKASVSVVASAMENNGSTTSFHSHVTTSVSTGSSIPTPQHPIPALHPAFLESIQEASTSSLPLPSPSTRPAKPTYHRITKLFAQLTFGLHLLYNNLAKSESVCVAILQSHIDTLDAYLAKKSAAISDAASDITTRLEYLRIPLAPDAASIFDQMLESRDFRAQILKRNAKLEHVVRRTTQGLERAMRDTVKTMEAVDICDTYMQQLKGGWTSDRLVRVYDAMKHNVQMWRQRCIGLQSSGAKLHGDLLELAGLILEVESRTDKASRKTVLLSMKVDRRGTGAMVMEWQQTVAEKPLPQTPRMDERLEAIGIKRTGFECSASRDSIRYRRQSYQNCQQSSSPPRSRPPLLNSRSVHPKVIINAHASSGRTQTRKQKSQREGPREVDSDQPCPGRRFLKRAGTTGRMLAKKVATRYNASKPATTPKTRSGNPRSISTLRWIPKPHVRSGDHPADDSMPGRDSVDDSTRRGRCKGMCIVL